MVGQLQLLLVKRCDRVKILFNQNYKFSKFPFLLKLENNFNIHFIHFYEIVFYNAVKSVITRTVHLQRDHFNDTMLKKRRKKSLIVQTSNKLSIHS